MAFRIAFNGRTASSPTPTVAGEVEEGDRKVLLNAK